MLGRHGVHAQRRRRRARPAAHRRRSTASSAISTARSTRCSRRSATSSTAGSRRPRAARAQPAERDARTRGEERGHALGEHEAVGRREPVGERERRGGALGGVDGRDEHRHAPAQLEQPVAVRVVLAVVAPDAAQRRGPRRAAGAQAAHQRVGERAALVARLLAAHDGELDPAARARRAGRRAARRRACRPAPARACAAARPAPRRARRARARSVPPRRRRRRAAARARSRRRTARARRRPWAVPSTPSSTLAPATPWRRSAATSATCAGRPPARAPRVSCDRQLDLRRPRPCRRHAGDGALERDQAAAGARGGLLGGGHDRRRAVDRDRDRGEVLRQGQQPVRAQVVADAEARAAAQQHGGPQPALRERRHRGVGQQPPAVAVALAEVQRQLERVVGHSASPSRRPAHAARARARGSPPMLSAAPAKRPSSAWRCVSSIQVLNVV